jgi:hypothetical protein
VNAERCECREYCEWRVCVVGVMYIPANGGITVGLKGGLVLSGSQE